MWLAVAQSCAATTKVLKYVPAIHKKIWFSIDQNKNKKKSLALIL